MTSQDFLPATSLWYPCTDIHIITNKKFSNLLIEPACVAFSVTEVTVTCGIFFFFRNRITI